MSNLPRWVDTSPEISQRDLKRISQCLRYQAKAANKHNPRNRGPAEALNYAAQCIEELSTETFNAAFELDKQS